MIQQETQLTSRLSTNKETRRVMWPSVRSRSDPCVVLGWIRVIHLSRWLLKPSFFVCPDLLSIYSTIYHKSAAAVNTLYKTICLKKTSKVKYSLTLKVLCGPGCWPVLSVRLFPASFKVSLHVCATFHGAFTVFGRCNDSIHTGWAFLKKPFYRRELSSCSKKLINALPVKYISDGEAPRC